ncbi:phytoene desaturase family protein [Serinibacter salmoneus]|uniref:Phytoene dehydrogenase-like protein n=1 Tax=Serinibacter salmoneus TaxID=556530 RepID=A0A2A9D1J7_9MICO|nr:NAD(P)/FAD-dependent oxidoreductase [Serinibacter salmoneus]PFG20523.1 phytoene dehydrogenase-like protein [Serinibacter salmoneus]
MAREATDVVVVGSGPNGLAAAVTAARAGLSVTLLEAQETLGGGSRTLDLQLAPGVVHDICSAVHPMALASPFLREFDLAARGVRLAVPEVSYAQPLDGGRAGLAWRDLDRTVEGLGPDGAAWRSLMAPLAQHSDAVVALAMGDKRSVPPELLSAGGMRAALAFAGGLLGQGTVAWDRGFTGQEAPALLTGVAAHAIAPVPGLAPAGTMLLLGALAHAGGWPIPVGGSQAIADALLADLVAHGGVVRTGVPVTTWRDLPRARAYLMDVTPRAAASIWGDRLPARVRRGLEAFRYGDAAAKVDFVLSEPVPWAAPGVSRAGTVHVGGSRADMALAEAEIAAGRHAEAPMVLASEPDRFDPSRRSAAGLRPLWTYAHVPAGSTRDVTEDVTRQIERFAPGFREVIVASRCVPAAEMAHHNANYIGGDIAAGAVSIWRMVARPRASWDPYALGIPGVSLCSSSTPPGPGVHGMSGWFAARRVLRSRFGVAAPSLAPA